MEEKRAELALRLETLERALATLEEALAQPFSVIVRDAAIQRFEYTFELAWKLFRKVARIEGLEVNSPRQAIRAGLKPCRFSQQVATQGHQGLPGDVKEPKAWASGKKSSINSRKKSAANVADWWSIS